MNIEDLLGVVVFAVVVILSMASKALEARKNAQREQEKQQRPQQQLSAKTRQKIHGRVQPMTATARQGQTPPAAPQARPVRVPKPVEQELLETLFGVKLGAEDGEPATVPQPKVRDATEQMVQRLRGQAEPQARPANIQKTQRKAPPRVPVSDDEGPTTKAADVYGKEREFERKARETSEKFRRNVLQGLRQSAGAAKEHAKRSEQKPAQRKPKSEGPPAKQVPAQRPGLRSGVGRLFSSPAELRRAIIVSEVLGRPVSMRGDSSAA